MNDEGPLASSLVDRVAKAIYDAMDITDSLDGTSAERYARAATEAMPIEVLLDALEKVAEPAPDAVALGVAPGMEYWATVATRRQDIARRALRLYPSERK